jgi:hypothetical protein
MTEKLLQYIWQFQHFNSRQLQTAAGEHISIIQRGTFNYNQGPDFINARIKVADTVWAGNIELHVKASDWDLHSHSSDPNYKNIILHVVWKNDRSIHETFPVLELEPYVSNILLDNYEQLMQSAHFIACGDRVAGLPYLHFAAWKERLLVERLQQRSKYVEALLNQTQQHWEEVFWWMLAKNFGIRINADSFERIAKTIPITILGKHKNQLHQIEAILLGQAAILDKKFEEDYPNMLRREYEFLKKKYGLEKAHAPLYYLRMRPANFPSIRLAQLAMLIHQSHHLFSTIRETTDINAVKKLLAVTANDYWHYHYVLDEPTAFSKKTLGAQMIQNILINTVVPMLYAYGYLNSQEHIKQKALQWLEQIAAENNSITKGYLQLGVTNKNAFDSQALLQLKNEYCNHKRCLQCAVGNWILKEKEIAR